MWEDRYAAARDYLFGTAPARVLVENPGWFRAGQSVLAVSDGEGRNSAHLARLGMDVTAFDLSRTAVERGRALARKAGVAVDYSVSEWDQWDWSRGFDMVLGVFIQFADPEFRARQFADMRRALRPGGVLFLHGYTREQIALGTGGPPFIDNMYTLDLLAESFGDWEIQRLAAYERDVQEGRGHSGRSALIDLVARKPG